MLIARGKKGLSSRFITFASLLHILLKETSARGCAISLIHILGTHWIKGKASRAKISGLFIRLQWIDMEKVKIYLCFMS